MIATNVHILSLETATDVCSISLHQDGKLVTARHIFEEKSHSKLLASLVDDMMKDEEMGYVDLSAVAISKGPGSYTGLRIGTAFAKGLCFGLDIPLIGVNTLESMAVMMKTMNPDLADSPGLLCPMLDARRMEVYSMLLDSSLAVVETTKAIVIEADSFSDYLAESSIHFFGNGASKCKQALDHNENAHFIDNFTISSESVGQIAYEKFQMEHFEVLSSFEPDYLKPFLVGKPKSLLKNQDV